LLAESDVISLHLPLSAETRHLIDAGRLSRMKPTTYLVNASRGPLVDPVALLERRPAGGNGAERLRPRAACAG
jgi:phosphoglycerate dehydrogenase-like enzyme